MQAGLVWLIMTWQSFLGLLARAEVGPTGDHSPGPILEAHHQYPTGAAINRTARGPDSNRQPSSGCAGVLVASPGPLPPTRAVKAILTLLGYAGGDCRAHVGRDAAPPQAGGGGSAKAPIRLAVLVYGPAQPTFRLRRSLALSPAAARAQFDQFARPVGAGCDVALVRYDTVTAGVLRHLAELVGVTSDAAGQVTTQYEIGEEVLSVYGPGHGAAGPESRRSDYTELVALYRAQPPLAVSFRDQSGWVPSRTRVSVTEKYSSTVEILQELEPIAVQKLAAQQAAVNETHSKTADLSAHGKSDGDKTIRETVRHFTSLGNTTIFNIRKTNLVRVPYADYYCEQCYGCF